MKHIKWDFTFKSSPLPAPVNLRRWTEVKIQVFRNMDMLHIKLKKIAHASNMVANVNLHGHADWSAIFVVRMQQSQPFRVAAHMFCIFSFFVACKHARNGASNTKFVNTKLVMASIHWSSPQRRSQNAEKLWTSKGD